MLPSPPILKTTIIQLNKELDADDKNYEILTNNYSNSPKSSNSRADHFIDEGSNTNVAKKKRRRSSANVDSEELAKRKSETKQLHSIIEKRRRIKINREFEALKYLIPACRSTSTGQATNPGSASKETSTSSNNGNKIDGMYKLTILKSSVEYILYLHHIIQEQHKLLRLKQQSLSSANVQDPSEYDFEIDFAKIPLNVNEYRNIDKEFDFKELKSTEQQQMQQLRAISPSPSISVGSTHFNRLGATFDIVEEEVDHQIAAQDADMAANVNSTTNIKLEDEDMSDYGILPQLPSPDITPDIAPILSILNRFNGQSQALSLNINQPIQNTQNGNKIPLLSSNLVSPAFFPSISSYPGSNNVSPLTNPIKSTFSGSANMSRLNSTSKFSLPDPAIKSNDIPKRKYFRSKVPQNNAVVSNAPLTIKSTSLEDISKAFDGKLSDQDASNTLLALRKSSIDSLLN